MYDCMAGRYLVTGAAWTIVAKNIGAGTFTYTETVPNAKVIYTYRVRAVSGSGCGQTTLSDTCSEWSNPVQTAVLPPSDLSAAWSGANAITLTWTQRDDTGQFAVERCTGVFQHRRINSFEGQAFDDPKCLPTGSNVPISFPSGTVPFTEIAKGIAGSAKGATITWTDSPATDPRDPPVAGTVYTYRVRSYTAAGSWRNWNARGLFDAFSAPAIPQAPRGIRTDPDARIGNRQ